jgi:hypothetical protein
MRTCRAGTQTRRADFPTPAAGSIAVPERLRGTATAAMSVLLLQPEHDFAPCEAEVTIARASVMAFLVAFLVQSGECQMHTENPAVKFAFFGFAAVSVFAAPKAAMPIETWPAGAASPDDKVLGCQSHAGIHIFGLHRGRGQTILPQRDQGCFHFARCAQAA